LPRLVSSATGVVPRGVDRWSRVSAFSAWVRTSSCQVRARICRERAAALILFERGVHRDDRPLADVLATAHTLVWRHGLSHPGHLCAVALLEDQLLLGQQVVGSSAQISLSLASLAAVSLSSSQTAEHLSPVLLLYMRAVVLVARPGADEGDLLVQHQARWSHEACRRPLRVVSCSCRRQFSTEL